MYQRVITAEQLLGVYLENNIIAQAKYCTVEWLYLTHSVQLTNAEEFSSCIRLVYCITDPCSCWQEGFLCLLKNKIYIYLSYHDLLCFAWREECNIWHVVSIIIVFHILYQINNKKRLFAQKVKELRTHKNNYSCCKY